MATAGAIWALRLSQGSLHVPLSYENDGQFYGLLVKEVIHGWYFTNPLLGAPFGSQLFDFPQGGDQLHFVAIKALGLTSSDWALVMNLFFLFTFPLCALTAYAVMRRCGVSRPASAVAGALFALLPYHFWHGEFHLFLSAYYAVPLACYLVVAVYRGDALFARRTGTRRGVLSWASRRSLVTVALCLVIGSADLYYAAFTVVLLAFAALVVGLVRRSWRWSVGAGIGAMMIAAVLAINISPSLVYRAIHGVDSQAFTRTPAQSEAGSLRPADLVLPLSRHRIAALGSLRKSYSGPWFPPEVAPSEGEAATLGIVATAGFVGLIVVLVATAVGRGAWWDPGGTTRAAAAGALSSLLFATIGGVTIAYVITPYVRQWVRLSIFIGFFSLLAVAQALDRVAAAVRGRPGGRLGFAALLGTVGALAFLDQTSAEMIPAYSRLTASYRSDQAFVGAIERRLGTGRSVLQLPYMPWPEPAFLYHMSSFAPVRGYLHARALRWSYGAIRGRPADWQAQLAGQPPEVVAVAAAASGFDGIYVDRFGYRGSAAASVEAALSRVVGTSPMLSPDRRFSFFDIRGYAQRLRSTVSPRRLLAVRDATLYPTVLDVGAGARLPHPPLFPTSGVGVHRRVRIRGHGELEAVSPRGDRRTVMFTAVLSVPGPATRALVQIAGARALQLFVGGQGVPICEPVRVASTAQIRFEVEGSQTLRVDEARLSDLAYEPFVPRLRTQEECSGSAASGSQLVSFTRSVPARARTS